MGVHYVHGNGIVGSCIARMLHDHGLDVQIVRSRGGMPEYEKERTMDALDTCSFPLWMEQRVASICDDSDIKSVSDVAENMRSGLVQIESVPENDSGFVVHESLLRNSKDEDLATQIDQAVWKVVELLWEVNSTVKARRNTIQTRLI